MALHTGEGVRRIDKTFGHGLDATSVHTVLENYLGDRTDGTVSLARSFLKKLQDLETFFESQTAFHNFGCSMLFLYDLGEPASAQVRLIDFVHLIISSSYLLIISGPAHRLCACVPWKWQDR